MGVGVGSSAGAAAAVAGAAAGSELWCENDQEQLGDTEAAVMAIAGHLPVLADQGGVGA